MTTTLQMIREVEAKWMKRLFLYNESHFKDAGLPSHNHWHHLRVWYYIRELLESLVERGIPYSADETEGLIIAAFFHDIAMHRTFGEVHGKWGAEQCKNYFSRGNPASPHCFQDVLKAIERHDDKKYLYQKGKEEKPGIGVLLSVADDLDAFGAPGIVRYTEILSLRGLEPGSIPEKVLINARSRMDHFSSTFTLNRYLIQKHQERYERLRDFFRAVMDETGQGKINRAIMDRIRENLSPTNQTGKLTKLLEPADTPAIKMLKQETADELKAFPNPLSL